MKISKDKINLCRARKQIGIGALAEAYGVSRTRIHAILNQRDVTVTTAGRLAKALGVDVTEILED